MKTYVGTADPDGFNGFVYIHEDGKIRPLPICLEYVNHSPYGLAWGYSGSGPAQLQFAFAILANALGLDTARRVYHEFKDRVIANLSQKFTLTEEFVINAAKSILQERELWPRT